MRALIHSLSTGLLEVLHLCNWIVFRWFYGVALGLAQLGDELSMIRGGHAVVALTGHQSGPVRAHHTPQSYSIRDPALLVLC